MGKVTTPMYRVEYRTNHLALGIVAGDSMVYRKEIGARVPVHTEIWNVRGGTNRTGYGMPTTENINRWRCARNDSMKRGGCNFHITEQFGSLQFITWARVVEQATGRVAAEWTAPAFEIA